MPITRRQFELEIDSKIEEWAKKVYAFLVEHKDEAFTSDELENQWRHDYDSRTWLGVESEVFTKALNKLVELRAAEERQIRGKYYYSCGYKPLEI